MDIGALSQSLARIDTANQVGTAVLAKAMDTNESLGEGIVSMIDSAAMERAVNPSVGSNVDVRI